MNLQGTNDGQRAGRGWKELSGWRELVVLFLFYLAYSWIRNRFGSGAAGSLESAQRNAEWIVEAEKALGLLIEDNIQNAFIDFTAFIQFWNLAYGLLHFVMPIVVLLFLWFRRPARYAFWRTASLVTTALALIGYVAFPLMPPRLMNDCGPYGGCDPTYGFVDTLREVGGLWSFQDSRMDSISNQFAAMPSLHVGWAVLCGLALMIEGRGLARGLGILWPLMMSFAVVVTANHWWLDGAAGVAVALIGLMVSALVGWTADESPTAGSHRADVTDPTPVLQ